MAAFFFAATGRAETFPLDFVLAFGATAGLVDEVFATAVFTVAWLVVKFPLLVKGIVNLVVWLKGLLAGFDAAKALLAGL